VKPWASPGAALGGTLAALLAGEALVRAFRPQPLRPAWDDEAAGVRVPRAGLRGRHRHPGAFDVTVTINTQRFRAAHDYAPQPPAGTARVAVLGDSLAFGWGTGDAETYPAQLERLLSTGGSRVEVINAGFPGTCLGEKLAWYESGVRSFRPHLVVLTLAGDDVDGDLYWRVYTLQDGEAVRDAAGPETTPARRTRGCWRLPGAPGWPSARSSSRCCAAPSRGLSRERTTGLGQDRPRRAGPRVPRRGLSLLRAELPHADPGHDREGSALAVVFVPFRQRVRRRGLVGRRAALEVGGGRRPGRGRAGVVRRAVPRPDARAGAPRARRPRSTTRARRRTSRRTATARSRRRWPPGWHVRRAQPALSRAAGA
jgi:hypothetical protein